MPRSVKSNRLDFFRRLLKEYMKGYAPFVSRQFATMKHHERLASDVYRTIYSDRDRLAENYGDVPYEYGMIFVPAMEFQ